MKKYWNFLQILLIINGLYFLFLASSCDEGGGPGSDLSRQEMISRTWKVNGDNVYIDGVKDVSRNYSNHRFAFTKEGNYTFAMDGQRSGTWSFNASQTLLLLDGGITKDKEVELARITPTELHLTFTLPKTFKDPEKKIRFELIPL